MTFLLKANCRNSRATIEVYQSSSGKVLRKSAPLEESGKLRAQFLWLEKNGGVTWLPVVRGEGRLADRYYYEMDYIDDAIPFFDIIHRSTFEQSSCLLKRICQLLIDRLGQSLERKEKHLGAFDQYLEDKIKGKINQCLPFIKDLQNVLHHKTISVNGLYLDNLALILERLTQRRQREFLASFIKSDPHGDPTIENILIRQDEVVLLDPNDENLLGCVEVDLGKLFQSLLGGYEFIPFVEDLCLGEGEISFTLPISAEYQILFSHLQGLLISRLGSDRVAQVYFHAAVHFCRLLPYKAIQSPTLFFGYYGTMLGLFRKYFDFVQGIIGEDL